MTREEARGLVQRWLARRGQQSPGLNDKGLGGASFGDVDFFFEHREDVGTLSCRASIYRFRGPANPRVVEGFRQLEKSSAFDTGGGRIEFVAESRTLCLSRLYTAPLPDAQLDRELQKLGEASIVWREQAVRQVAGRTSGF